MNTLMITILAGVIVAAISGLSVFAFTYYAVFKGIFNKILVIVFIVFVILCSLLTGYLYGFSDLKEFIVSGYQAIEMPLPRFSKIIYVYLVIGVLLAYLYIYLLDYLGRKIELAKKDRAKR